MKPSALPAAIWLGIAALIVVGLLWTSREGFIPTFDRSQERLTIATEDSSYAQQTNNFTPAPSDAYPPIRGVPGKDQVNQYQGYVV